MSTIEQKSEDNNIKGDGQTQTEEGSKLAQIKAGLQSSYFTHIFLNRLTVTLEFLPTKKKKEKQSNKGFTAREG